MAVQLSAKTEKTLQTSVVLKLTLAYLLNGICFAMSHGKGPCDGVGATVKIFAARASLQRACNNQIMTPRQLFDFASAENPSVAFYYATTEEHAQEAILLSHRFESARMIAGTHKLHCIRSVTSEVVEVKEFSNSKEFRLERVLPPTVQDKPLHQSRVMAMTDIKGYITDIAS